MSGHLRANCFCIHGYPSWHRLFGKPKPKPKLLHQKGSVVANVSHANEDTMLDSNNDTPSSGL